ncbi:hypothetical protein B0H67DRAFT_197578 [Lasiosphaeris hirsuta]|uniref:Secreted protein n=1 Tax=Lasiosphaeris hirsuta TaxID=260670 RepID=A0AA40ARF6_9PEZI|nr:hypothetical protein B0H67DRAFT_197578 [Lasiosphaeris hirsuta]
MGRTGTGSCRWLQPSDRPSCFFFFFFFFLSRAVSLEVRGSETFSVEPLASFFCSVNPECGEPSIYYHYRRHQKYIKTNITKKALRLVGCRPPQYTSTMRVLGRGYVTFKKGTEIPLPHTLRLDCRAASPPARPPALLRSAAQPTRAIFPPIADRWHRPPMLHTSEQKHTPALLFDPADTILHWAWQDCIVCLGMQSWSSWWPHLVNSCFNRQRILRKRYIDLY